MGFLRLDLWWLVPAVFVTIVLIRLLLRRPALPFTRVSLLKGAKYRASPARFMPLGMLALSLGIAIVALMEPVIPYSERQVEAEGLDIVFVIDLSLSMYDPLGLKDRGSPASATPSRLDATKDALRTFISLRREDRIGIVVFSDNAYMVCPLTFDREHLLNYFDFIDPKTLWGEGLTAIGEGIAVAGSLLSRQSPPHVQNKVIIVFTDGANTAGRDPIAALRDTSAEGIRIHVVGVDLWAEATRSPQVMEFIDAVHFYGGQYYAADSIAELDAASRALDDLEKGYLTVKNHVRNEPIGHWFAYPALVLLAGALALRVLPVFLPLH